MDVKLVAYGVMPDDATKTIIEQYLERSDRIKARKVTFYSVDTKYNEAVKARMRAEQERDEALAKLAELEVEPDGS